MYQRLSAVLFPVACLLLMGAIYWGYQEHLLKTTMAVKAENQYQRAFHDLSSHMDQLHQQLGNTLAVHTDSRDYHRKGLVNVWRLTSQAQNEIHQLPLTTVPVSDTEKFLSKLSSFAYKTSARDLAKEPLNDKEFATMKTLYEKSADISKDLQVMQHQVINHHLRWTDAEHVMAGKNVHPNAIADGFRSVNEKIGQYPDMNWGPSATESHQNHTFNALSGKPATMEEIQTKAAHFLGLPANTNVHVVEHGKGTGYESYSATVKAAKTGHDVIMDYSHHGGELLSFMHPRDIAAKSMSMEQAKGHSDNFLNQHGYKGLTPVSYDEAGNQGIFTYVADHNGTLIYPEKLTVKVALDNGEVIGLHATDYVVEHQKQRTLNKPKLSEKEAAKAIHPHMQSAPAHLAVIKNEDHADVLCYEYAGKMNGGYYRIYVNAETGKEEAVEPLADMKLTKSK